MHVHDVKTGTVLKWSIALMLALALAEAAAGYMANSLALLSDAGHNFTDSLALVLAWFALYVQSKPATESKTYGYPRAGVLAAFVNALLLVAIALYVFYEAYQRLRAPHPVDLSDPTRTRPRSLNAVRGRPSRSPSDRGPPGVFDLCILGLLASFRGAR